MPEQAVLLIHGIGEQRPMETLRGFVDVAWSTDTAQHRAHGDDPSSLWSKPYSLSLDFELRRLTTASNRTGWNTDFYEFYWQHLMQGTEARHVVSWARSLLWRSPATVPRHLRSTWLLLVLLVVLFGYLAYRVAALWGSEGDMPTWVNLLLTVAVLPVALGVLTTIVGDAARYLHVRPSNVQMRHQIRAAGLEVIEALHRKGYDRIIIVGHSLGSVIGYDILYHAWSKYHKDKPTAASPGFAALTALEDLVAEGNGVVTDAGRYHAAQQRYFEELKANGARWRVSDFITLGSPLAHAEILMAASASALRPKFQAREFAQCPPVLETKRHEGRILRRFSWPAQAAARTPHHAAVFAPVRWTNLYFPARLILWGDVVGGRLAGIFGGGVRDVAVRTRRRLGFLSHTLYWKAGRTGDTHLAELRKALDLVNERHPVPRQDAGTTRPGDALAG
jgi:hypothetical protein